MSERIVGDYVITRVNEMVDGHPAQTMVARLNPPNATHFHANASEEPSADSMSYRIDNTVYLFGQPVGTVIEDEFFNDYVLCEVIPVG